ncbi:hypothetical protein GCM10022243_63830 [Saccharothrix violaceirubra]|uniref:Copper-transporting ATPase n=1 Tax=Saccharothrix violaceirubra TaxID=413306 RepID=A0A7W7TAP0_9PSEU|nr:DUF6541 family protein [Saccharothrix violaceirubra]MBB4969132.1 hypothetical protein [Saccharothrix violaceirubra]
MAEASPLLTAGTIAVYLAVLFVPGGLVALAAGLRGWLLAAVAPVFTYLIAGLAGPWLSKIGIRFDVLTFVVSTVVIALLFLAARLVAVRLRGRGEPDTSPWAPGGHAAVVLAVVVGAGVGIFVLLKAMDFDLGVVPQDWDAGYHANGIRYIADTGDGSLYGTGKVNWYDVPTGVFYPNAYHLVGALVFKLTGATVPAVVNAHMALLPGLLVFELAAMVRHFRGRAVTAVFTALVAAASTSATYDNLWRGPLLTFTLGLALMPVLVVVVDRYLRRPGLDTGAAFAGVAIGMLCVHSSNLFGGVLFVIPFLVQRWWRAPRVMLRDILWTVPPGLAAVLVTLPHLLGAASIKGTIAIVDWPSTFPVSQSVGSLLTFQHIIDRPQYWLALPLWVGLAFAWRLGNQRWLLGAAALFGAVWVLTASYAQPWVARVTSPWWNDQYRLIALACVPLIVVAGHGFAVLHDRLAGLARDASGRPPVRAASVAVVAAAFIGLSGMYVTLNAGQVARGYGNAPGQDKNDAVVSTGEVLAFHELAKVVQPGERVLNDRNDGTLWMYAIAGVQPIAGHYDGSLESPAIAMLEQHFVEYDENAAVRAAVKRLNVRYVILGQGFVRGWNERAGGLRGLEGKPFLTKIYENDNAVVYRLVPPPGEVVAGG